MKQQLLKQPVCTTSEVVDGVNCHCQCIVLISLAVCHQLNITIKSMTNMVLLLRSANKLDPLKYNFQIIITLLLSLLDDIKQKNYLFVCLICRYNFLLSAMQY